MSNYRFRAYIATGLFVGSLFVAACAASPAPQVMSSPTSSVTANQTSSVTTTTGPRAVDCHDADMELNAGLVTDAESHYKKFLENKSEHGCAVNGLRQAVLRRAEAAEAAAQGDQALAAGNPKLAKRWYDYALTRDAGNKVAADGQAKTSNRSGQELTVTPVHPGPQILQMVVPFLIALLVLAVAVRLATLIVGPTWREPRWWYRRGLWGVVGLALVATGAAGWVGMVYAGYEPLTSNLLFRWLVPMLLSILGVLILTLVIGHGLSMQVGVQNEQGQTVAGAAAYLVARLSALGSARPRGIKSPQGSDVTTLPDNALSMLPQARILQAVVNVARALLPVTPWRANVTLGSGNVATVQLTRNGRPVEPISIDRASLTIQDLKAPDGDKATSGATAQPELLTGAAAYLLLKLASAHPRLKHGLCGARQWLSLAYQVIANEPPNASDLNAKTELYARAVDLDPLNRAARLGYLDARAGRGHSDAKTQQLLATRLDALYSTLPPLPSADPQPTRHQAATGWAGIGDTSQSTSWSDLEEEDGGLMALRMRILYSRAAAWINRGLLLEEHDPERSEAFKKAVEPAKQLLALTNLVADSAHGKCYSEELREYAKDMKAIAGLPP